MKRLQERLRHPKPAAATKVRTGYDEPCCYPEDRPRQLVSLLAVLSPQKGKGIFFHKFPLANHFNFKQATKQTSSAE